MAHALMRIRLCLHTAFESSGRESFSFIFMAPVDDQFMTLHVISPWDAEISHRAAFTVTPGPTLRAGPVRGTHLDLELLLIPTLITPFPNKTMVQVTVQLKGAKPVVLNLDGTVHQVTVADVKRGVQKQVTKVCEAIAGAGLDFSSSSLLSRPSSLQLGRLCSQ